MQPLFDISTSFSRFRSRRAGRDYDAPLLRLSEALVSVEDASLVHGRRWYSTSWEEGHIVVGVAVVCC